MRDEPSFYDQIGRAVSGDSTRSPNELAMPARPMPESVGFSRWAANDRIFWGAKQTHDKIPPGLYKCGAREGIGLYLERQHNDTDHIITLPDSVANDVVKEFQQFWAIEDKFVERGLLHKRGIMLWGPPGSGKTATLQLLVKIIVEELMGIVLFVDDPILAGGCLQMVRSIEPRRPIVCVLEDLGAVIQSYRENNYLALLDGEAQVNNVVFLATTNYPERLDRRFIDRPSRFDHIRYVGMPSAAARRAYLAHKEKSLSPADIDAWVGLSDGFSIAHLREMIISVKCFGHPINQVVDRLNKMRAKTGPSSEKQPGRSAMGIGDFAAAVN